MANALNDLNPSEEKELFAEWRRSPSATPVSLSQLSLVANSVEHKNDVSAQGNNLRKIFLDCVIPTPTVS